MVLTKQKIAISKDLEKQNNKIKPQSIIYRLSTQILSISPHPHRPPEMLFVELVPRAIIL